MTYHAQRTLGDVWVTLWDPDSRLSTLVSAWVVPGAGSMQRVTNFPQTARLYAWAFHLSASTAARARSPQDDERNDEGWSTNNVSSCTNGVSLYSPLWQSSGLKIVCLAVDLSDTVKPFVLETSLWKINAGISLIF